LLQEAQSKWLKFWKNKACLSEKTVMGSTRKTKWGLCPKRILL